MAWPVSVESKGRAVGKGVKARSLAANERGLTGVPHEADDVAAGPQLLGNADCRRDVAAAVPRDEQELSHVTRLRS